MKAIQAILAIALDYVLGEVIEFLLKVVTFLLKKVVMSIF